MLYMCVCVCVCAQACLCVYNFVLYMSCVYTVHCILSLFWLYDNRIKPTHIFCCVQVSEPTSKVVINAREIKVSEATFSG